MYNDLILVLNQSYRKFKEKEKDTTLFFHFLAVLALKYIYDSKDKLYPFKPEASQTENLKAVFSQMPVPSKAPLLDKTIQQLSKKYAATMAVLFDNISFRELVGTRKKETDTRLTALIEEIGDLSLGASAEETGAAVEYLIEKFAEEHFHKSGFLYTPRSISRLMAELAEVNENIRVYDPAAGLGTLLIQAAKAGNIPDYKLYGQEVNPQYAQLCKYNMLFNGLLKAEIETGNSLQDSKFMSGKKPILFDRVITHPPFDIEALLPADPEQLFESTGHTKSPFMVLEEPAVAYRKSKEIHLSEDTTEETSFLSHILDSLQDDGKAAIIVPHGVLFKLGNAYALRKQLISRNMIEAVIDLPPNIFYSSKVNVSVLILNKKKKHSDILFIDASQNYEPDRRRNKLRTEHSKQVIQAYHAFKSSRNYAHRASIQEVTDKANDYNLTAKRYVKQTTKSSATDLEPLKKNIDQLTSQLENIRKELDKEINSFTVK
ncbi:N-6 DNA methylase [Rhodocytophaga rosea]|uniref:site-specific DNA-methyltransferase (adenine-specific) n=1 Tax=Rhodocytophaga rosea TaxID=2704465 RepID=A0A6C0GFX1_9BACT|nr:N-6 DNA methylase [Rhodocytophaga rosea]QHT66580.1 N-6 DNA methylase [Rhodocytophaga rosea]